MRILLIPICLVALMWPQQIVLDGKTAYKPSAGSRIELQPAETLPSIALMPLNGLAKTAHAATEASHAIAATTALTAEALVEVPIQKVCETLAAAADASGLPAPFFLRLIWQESRFDQRAVSSAGALGVAQFMPEVAAERGLERPFDPLAALWASAFFLREHYRTFGNLGLAAMAYNAGAKRVQDWLARRGKLPEETRKYVTIITGHAPEKWIEPKPIELALALPRRAPCADAAGLSQGASVTLIDVQLEEPIREIIETAKAKAAKAKAARKAKLAKAAKNRRQRQARAKEARADKKADKKAKTAAASAKPTGKKAVRQAKAVKTPPARGDKKSAASAPPKRRARLAAN